MFSSVRQNSNHLEHGDLVARDKHETHHHYSVGENKELTRLYEQFKIERTEATECSGFSDKLQHYFTAATDSEIRSLDIKLKESGRDDLIFFAKMLKETAAKQIMQHQTSASAQRIYTIILDELHTNYMLSVIPQIQADASRAEIDHAINRIIDKVRDMLGENMLELTAKDLLGFIFFLGGNCHIRWDKC